MVWEEHQIVWRVRDVHEFGLRLQELEHDSEVRKAFVEETRTKNRHAEENSLKYAEFLNKLSNDRTSKLDAA